MHRAKRLILSICCLVIVCGIWGACYCQLRHDRNLTEKAAETNAANLTKAFEEHVLCTVRQVDSALLILRDSHLRHPASFPRQLAIFKSTLPNNQFIQAGVIDRQGKLVFSEHPLPATPLDLSDREHFIFHRDHREDVLFISKPMLGRLSGRWSIQFARKLLNRDGSFGGVMVVSVAPEYFSSFFRTVDLGQNGVVSLLGSDRVIRARSAVGSFHSDATGQTLPAQRPCFDPKLPAAGSYTLPSATDQVNRIWAYRRLQQYPLIVTVGLARDEVFGPARARGASLRLWCLCVSLLTLAATGTILWLDRKQGQSERSLREANQRLQLATASGRQGVWEWDIPKNTLAWDARTLELFGVAAETFSGQVADFQRALHPDDLPGTLGALKAALKGERDYRCEFRVQHHDGALRVLKVEGLVLRDAAGRGVRMLGLARDITEQVSAVQALRESEARFKTLAEASFEGIAISAQGRYLDVNTRLTQMLGYRREEMIGMEIARTLPPGERSRIVANIAASCGSDVEHEILCKDGSRRFVEAHGRTIVQDGRELRITAIRDITEKKRMERALHESEEQFRTLCDAAPIGIFRADPTGRVTYGNPRWEQIIGLPAREGIGHGWMKSVHPEDLDGLVAGMREVKPHGSIKTHELRHLGPQGATVWARVLVSPVLGADGAVLSHVGTLEDITEIRQARQELLKTQKLESLGVLAGGIAHDFNNILTAVFGNISLARFQLDEPAEVARRLEDAESAMVRATDLTKQLLTFSRGGAPVKKIIELEALLREAAGFVLHGSSVTCQFDLAEEICPVEADEGQLGQVFHNIMLNAVQAMPGGGSIIVVARNVSCEPQGERFVRITVTDTGTGIDEGNLPRIFDPYFTTKAQGSGLGLATCYSIIKKHGGKIRASSQPGAGSSFIISLPASASPAAADPKSSTALHRGSGRVLVMDDDATVRAIAQGILKQLGYSAEFTEHGAEAVELYLRRREEGTPFFATILDLTVPGGMGGRETMERLLQLDPEIRAVVSSGYSNDPVMANYRDYGFSAVLCKPYRPQEMGEVLWELALS